MSEGLIDSGISYILISTKQWLDFLSNTDIKTNAKIKQGLNIFFLICILPIIHQLVKY